MKFLTEALREQLIKNHQEQDGTKDFVPVVKFFNPYGQGTWLATELDPETNILFGLADIGCPEMGYFSLQELEEIRIGGILPLERDAHTTFNKPLTEYADDARNAGSITV